MKLGECLKMGEGLSWSRGDWLQNLDEWLRKLGEWLSWWFRGDWSRKPGEWLSWWSQGGLHFRRNHLDEVDCQREEPGGRRYQMDEEGNAGCRMGEETRRSTEGGGKKRFQGEPDENRLESENKL